jgi:hypothetical protein
LSPTHIAAIHFISASATNPGVSNINS